MNFIHRCKPHGKRLFAADATTTTTRNSGPLISDPTGTLSLQKKFQKELRMRWDAVRKQVPDAVLRNSDVHATINSIIGDPVKSFQSWIDEAMRQLVMGINGSWTLPYVRGAGDIGTQRAKTLVAAAQSPPVNPPAYVDRVPVMQSLAISELQGIMDAVSQQAVREFTTGLMIVRAPNKTAKAIQNIIDTTGKRRSDMLANFMCVRTFGTATLDHYRANGVNSVGTVPERIVSPSPIRDAKAKSGSRGGPLRGPGLVRLLDKKQAPDDEDLVEVLTASDDDVCQECQDISDEGPYDLDEAESLIPAHPNCRCIAPNTTIEGAVIAGSKSWYAGPMVTLHTASGKRLSITVNHPVVTSKGMFAAGTLRKGMQLISNGMNIRGDVSDTDYENHAPTVVEQIFDTLALGGCVRVPTTTMDFHGDGKFIDSHIDLVSVSPDLLVDFQATFAQSVGNQMLIVADRTVSDTVSVSDLSLSFTPRPLRPFNPLLFGCVTNWNLEFTEYLDHCTSFNSKSTRQIKNRITTSIAGCNDASLFATDFDECLVFQSESSSVLPRFSGLGHLAVADKDRLRHRPNWSGTISENSTDSLVVDPVLVGQGYNRPPGNVVFDEIISIDRFSYRGHVYDLQTTTGYLMAEGLAISNCAFVPWDDERFADVHDDFKEEDHPRDEKGKFAAGQGNGASEDDHWNSIGGAPFKSMDAPKDQHGWAQVEGQNHGIDEPPLPNLKQKPYTYSYTSTTTGEQKTKTVQPPDKRMSSGVIMREPDGRTWLVKPSNNFGGYNWTFPKGGVEEGLHPQANAIKEAYEESGLHAKITGYAGDYHGDTSITRMYHAERIGGHPKDHQWETEQVALAHPDDVMGMLNRSRDKKIASHHILKDFIGDEFREEDHPRDDHGKFTEAGGGGATPNAGSDPKFEAKIEKLKSGATKGGYNFSHFAGNYGPSDIGGMHALEVDNEHEIAVINAAAKHGIALTEHPEYSGSTFKLLTASHAVEAPAPTISIPHQLDMNELNKIGGKKGSNAGGTYEDKNGKQFYIKNPATTDHVQNELMAAKLYQLAGARTMDYVPVKGGAHVATELQNLDKNNISQFTDAEKTQAQKDFGVHAWLANWDAAGTGGDNQVIVGGKTHTVDVGGSLKYRAQGTAKKPEEFGNDVKDTKTLLDPSKNADAAKLYGSMTDAQKIASYKVVTAIPDNDIRKTVYAAGGNTEMADKMVARKADLAKQATELEDKQLTKEAFASFKENKQTIEPPPSKTPSITPHPDPTSKMGIIHHHLTKEGGTTSEELKKALNWPAIGIPKMASNLNLNLEKTKEGGVFKYKGTPMTPEQIAANKNAPKAAKAEPAAPPPPPPEPPKTILGPSTKPEPYPPEVAKLFEKSTPHPLDFQKELSAKGIAHGDIDEHSADESKFKISAPTPSAVAMAEVAKNHPEWKLAQGMKSTYFAPKSAFGAEGNKTSTQLLQEPIKTAPTVVTKADVPEFKQEPTTAKFEPGKPFITAAGFDINKPTGAFKQSLHEHNVEYQIGHGELYEHYTPNTPKDKDTMAQIAQYHPATIANGDGSFSIKNESVQAAGATQAGVAATPTTFTPTAKSPEAIAQHFASTLEKSYGIKPLSVAPFGPNSDLHGEHYVIVPKKDAATAASVAQMHPDIAEMPNPTGGNSIYHSVTKPTSAAAPAEAPKTVLGPTTAKPAPAAPPVTPPTDAELAKAKKNVKLQMQYVPGASGLENHPEAQKLLAAFNAKYEGKTLAEHELPAKVADFKQLAENMKPLMSEQQKAAATAAAETQAKQMATAAAAKAKLAEEEAKLMADPETAKHLAALKAIGSNIKPNQHDIDFIAKHNLDITPVDAKYIRAYVGHHYGPVNEQLRKGSLSPDQASFAKRLSDALNRMPIHKGTVERGASLSEADFNKYVNNVGKTVVENQFTSAGKKQKLWGSHNFTIVSHAGRDISKFNPGEGGGEVVFDKGSLFHVTKVDKAKKHIWMEEVA